MFAWRIQLVHRSGKLHEVMAPGIDLRRSLTAAGYDLTQVVHAERCLNYDRLIANIPQQAQMIFLMKLLPYYISGIPDQSAQLFKNYVPIQKMNKHHPKALDINLNLSERLEVLRFNPLVVTIIRAGERGGEIATALKQAITNLQKEIEMNRQARKGVVGGALLFIASLAILLGVSAGTSQALDSIIEAGIIDQRNFSGVLLNALGDYARNYLWTFFLAAALVGGLGIRYKERLKHLWPISIFNTYLNVLRSIRLVSVWLILERAGLSIEHDEQLLSTAVGKKHAERISKQRKKGETFSDLLDRQYFSATLKECCLGMSALSTSNRIYLLEQIAQLLDAERQQTAAVMSRTFYIIGMTIALGAIVLILSGILLPIYSSGLGGIQL